MAWGGDNAATARIDQRSPAQVTLAKGVVAGTVNLALGIAFASQLSGWSPSSWSPSWRQAVAALVVGAIGYGLSITLWVEGARDLGAARGQVLFAAAPFIGAVLSWTVLGEAVVGAQLVALVLAGTGVALSLGTSHGHVHHHDALKHEHCHGDGHHEHTLPGSSPPTGSCTATGTATTRSTTITSTCPTCTTPTCTADPLLALLALVARA